MHSKALLDVSLHVQGVLKGILDLSLDVLINVCSHLDLATVYHLSRLSRRFFRFLRGNSSLSYIWEWAREESGLPELTAPGLTPVQYAHLLFGKHCQVRLKLRPSPP